MIASILCVLWGSVSSTAQEVEILSLSQNGVITWSNSTLNVTCRVEWASSPEGPWHDSWDSLTGIAITNHVTERAVPMFYRVVATEPPEPLITDISASEALTLIMENEENPDFVILDIRTPGEFASGHIKTALNIDYYSAAFENDLSQLDKTKTYLVHCASGGRSGRSMETFRNLGFLEVFNMRGGFWAFTQLPGAGPYLAP
jgi:rhodanese-related sulfurtransferase